MERKFLVATELRQDEQKHFSMTLSNDFQQHNSNKFPFSETVEMFMRINMIPFPSSMPARKRKKGIINLMSVTVKIAIKCFAVRGLNGK